MNSLQFQSWLGGIIPILNPKQDLLYINTGSSAFPLIVGASVSLSTLIPNLAEIKTILIIHSDASGAVMKGYFEIGIVTNSGRLFVANTNETSVFINTCEEPIIEIDIINYTSGNCNIYLYS
jgi:hypothetical protein